MSIKKRSLKELDWSDWDLSFELPKKKKEKIVEKPTCTICLEDVDENKSMTVLDCGHKFHLKCFMELQVRGDNNKKCPNCRQEQDIPDMHQRQQQTGISMDMITMLMNSGVFDDIGSQPQRQQVWVPRNRNNIVELIQQGEGLTVREVMGRYQGGYMSNARMRGILNGLVRTGELQRRNGGRNGSYLYSRV